MINDFMHYKMSDMHRQLFIGVFDNICTVSKEKNNMHYNYQQTLDHFGLVELVNSIGSTNINGVRLI